MTRQFIHKLGSAALLTLLAFAISGCKKDVAVEETQEEAPGLAAVVRMGDARVAGQLATGFYGVEQNAWRWTRQNFSVVLRPPAGSAQKGAKLNFKFTIPDSHIAKLQSVTLSGEAGGQPLAPETYKTGGNLTYSRDIPASALTGESVKVDFHLDKVMPPAGADKRELGVVALSVGLEPK
jgi:hypothetical protein